MKRWEKEIEQLIIPSLPEYGTNQIALVGCRTSDIYYDACEIDIIIFNSRKPGWELIPTKEAPLEVHRVRESAEEMAKTNPHFLCYARTLHDPTLTLPGILQSIKPMFLRKWVKEEIIGAMTLLGRAKSCEGRGDHDSARLWLMASVYRLITSTLVDNGLNPSPSHFITLIRNQDSPLFRRLYAAANEILGLRLVGLEAVNRRFNAFNRLMARMKMPRPSTNVIRSKISFLLKQKKFAEAYSLLGYHILRALALFKEPLLPAPPPESFRIELPTAVKKRAFPQFEEALQDLATQLEEVVIESWKKV